MSILSLDNHSPFNIEGVKFFFAVEILPNKMGKYQLTAVRWIHSLVKCNTCGRFTSISVSTWKHDTWDISLLPWLE